MAKTMTKETKWQGWAILGTLAVFVAKALVVLVSTPIFLGMWLLNFCKAIIGLVLTWVVGKFALSLLIALVLEGLLHFKWITQAKGDVVMEWFNYHFMGFVTRTAPEGAVHFFSYPKIEFTLIVLFALVTATVMTINPDKV